MLEKQLMTLISFELRDRHDQRISPRTFIGYLHDIHHSHVFRSIVWMFCRTVPEPKDRDELEAVYVETFEKEFRASQIPFVPLDTMIFDWRVLMRRPAGILSPRWFESLYDIIPRFTRLLRRLPNLYPKVQRSKNMSQETGQEYWFRHPECDVFNVTSRDVEVHYGMTGEQLGGNCEMRQSWKFNDLKPRFYYCQGGRDYFASRYMKRITVALMESIWATQTQHRVHPDRYLAMQDDEYIVFWDFQAFTSSLSELRHFLYYVARGIEDYGTYDLWIVDYFLGLVQKSPVDILLDYNETVNVEAPFSLHRLIDRFIHDYEDITYHQRNSGMLGVLGNIGLSTACHGAVIEGVVGPEKGICVGDDGAAIPESDPNDELVPWMSKLGRIVATKFDILYPLEEGPKKFLKRGVWRTNSGIYLDYLFTLPNSVFVDGIYDPRRTVPPDFSLKARIFKVVKSVGAVLWDVRDNYCFSMSDQEYFYLVGFLQTIYKKLNLPKKGFFGSYQIKNSDGQSETLRVAIPPLTVEYDYRRVDWLEAMFDLEPNEAYLPLYGVEAQVPMPSIGDEGFVATNQGWKMLEDLGYVTLEMMSDMILSWSPENKRRMRQFLRRSEDIAMKPMYRMKCIADIPPRFDFLFNSPPIGVEYHLVSTLL